MEKEYQYEGVDYIWLCVEDNFKTDFLGSGLLQYALGMIERSEANHEPIVVHW